MSRLKLILITGAAALAVSAIAVPAAQAQDVWEVSCTFTGATGNIDSDDDGAGEDGTGGVQSVFTDLADGNLADTDNDGVDGDYFFDNVESGAENLGQCMIVGDQSNGVGGTDIYPAEIVSHGEYDNTVCGTGTAVDNDVDENGKYNGETTSVTLGPGMALGNAGPDIADADYSIQFVAGEGPLTIQHADLAPADGMDDQVEDGAGFVNIVPTETEEAGGEPCVTEDDGGGPSLSGDVTKFQASGAFTTVLAIPGR